MARLWILYAFAIILGALMLMEYVGENKQHNHFSFLKKYVWSSDRGNHVNLYFNRRNTSGGFVITPSSRKVVSPDITLLQDTMKQDLDAVVFSAFPDMISRNFPREFKCPGTDRTITFRQSAWDATGIGEADVIIFAAEIANETWERVTRVRKPHQVWVYTTGESAYYSPQVRSPKGVKPLGFGKDFRFNMSFTYHSKSEVVEPYGSYIPLAENEQNRNPKTKSKRPTDMVAWVSSHCDHTFWNRTGFVEILSSYLPIDKYGACGKHRIPYGIHGIQTLKRYKFYLAFENSCCSEYITEKFWNALAKYESVPIVIGPSKSDYEKVAPPNSFVYAGDFNSMEDLASYIRRVANNDTLYNKYHEWRKHGRIKQKGSIQCYPFTTRETACLFLNFLEQNAWKGTSQPLSMKLDPFGPEWLGSCKSCSDKEWITNFELSSNAYDPIVYLHTTWYKFTDMRRRPIKGQAVLPTLL